jgi:hypothetical protein
VAGQDLYPATIQCIESRFDANHGDSVTLCDSL